jgi:trk system potassium uptake protein TrkA
VEQKSIRSAVIVGGSLIGINLARLLLDHNIDVRIIDKDFAKCTFLSEQLLQCTIINHDATDLDFILSEKLGHADVFISCTQEDEVNVLVASLGKQAGCENVVAILAKSSYRQIVDQLGITHAVSPWISAGNYILALAFSRTVTSLVSMYEHQAEIMEIKVSQDSKVVGIPLSELGPLFPKDFLIAMIQNRGRTMIAHGNRIISPGDTVIVISNPRHFSELEKIF